MIYNLIYNLYWGSGFFRCCQCKSIFERFIGQSIKPTCPFCGRTIGGTIIDDMIEWGVGAFSGKLNNKIKKAMMGFESCESTINCFLLWLDSGRVYIKSKRMSESFAIEEL